MKTLAKKTFVDSIKFIKSGEFIFMILISLIAVFLSMFGNIFDLQVIVSGELGRGINNSVWVGLKMSIITILFIYPLGFLFLKNNMMRSNGKIKNDKTYENKNYIIYKHFSNFIILSLITLIIFVLGGIMQVIRGENPLNLIELLTPWLIIILPLMYFTATLSILFQVVPFLKRTFGLIVFIFLYFSQILIPIYLNTNGKWALDILGISKILDYTNYSLIIFTWQKVTKTFLLENFNFSTSFLFSRLLVIVVGLIILFSSQSIFKRSFGNKNI